jgi:hypothetical protein
MWAALICAKSFEKQKKKNVAMDPIYRPTEFQQCIVD